VRFAVRSRRSGTTGLGVELDLLGDWVVVQQWGGRPNGTSSHQVVVVAKVRVQHGYHLVGRKVIPGSRGRAYGQVGMKPLEHPAKWGLGSLVSFWARALSPVPFS